MKNSILLLLFFLTAASTLRATHIVGAELTYECLGFNAATNEGTYRIRMNVYRDGNSTTQFDDPAPIGIYNGNGTLFTVENVPITTETNVPCNTGNPCLTCPPNVSVWQAYYTFTVTLPYNPQGYTIVYQRCCRNGSITNITNPGATGSTYFIELTGAAQLACNDSPTFNSLPPIAICRNKPLSVSSASTDTNGDQLVYSLCTPLDGGDQQNPQPNPPLGPPYQNVNYSGAYNSNNPLGAAANVQINPTSGLITGLPTQLGQFVVAICVQEFRNGVLMSTLRRDFQFNVVNCTSIIVPTPVPDSTLTGTSLITGKSCDNTVNFSYSTNSQPGQILGQQWTFWNTPTSPTFSQTSTAATLSVTFPGPGLYNGRILVNPAAVNPAFPDCSDSSDFQIRIWPPRVANFGLVIDSCNYVPIQTLNLSTAPGATPLTYSWNFGSGLSTSTLTTPSWLPPNAGTYPVTLKITDSHGCTASYARTTDYFPAATANFTTLDPNGCTPFTTTFNNTSFPFINSYQTNWVFGNGNTSTVLSPPAQTYTTPGLYNVGLQVVSPWGCTSNVTKNNFIEVYSLPNAAYAFSFDSCVIGPVTYTNTSTATYPNATLTNYQWDFGDNSGISNVTNPVHQFGPQVAGSFITNLTVTDSNGCTDTVVDTVEWFPGPIIDVTVPSGEGCVPFTVAFTNNSYPLNGYTTAWNFGDGQTSLAASPTHIFTQFGTFEVNLVITSPTGCIKNFKDTIVVHENPTAGFTFDLDSCNISPVAYTSTSTDNTANDALTDWLWYFDDGDSSLLVSPSHLFPNSGDYDVTHIVTDINGCRDTSTHTVSWFPEPVIDVDILQQEGCFGDTVHFVNNSYPITGYTTAWYFGDGTTSLLASPNHVYAQHGVYYVTLVITSPTAICQATSVDTIIVHENPHASFSTFVDNCIYQPYTITDASTSNATGDALQQWIWNYDDSVIDTLLIGGVHTHLPTNSGYFDVLLTVVDANGCRDTVTHTVEWFPEPVVSVDILKQIGCLGDTVVFQNNSYPINGYTTTWTFGDNTGSSLPSPIHIYAQPGIYQVNLTISSPNGFCVKTFVDTVVVNGLPVADFSFGGNNCVVGPVNFVDESIIAVSPIANPLTNWTWTFGDGNGSTLQNVTYQYGIPGTYTASLTVTDAAGCTATANHSLDWYPGPPVSVVVDDSTGCPPHAVNLSYNVGTFDVSIYGKVWDFGDGTPNFVGDTPPTHTYTQPGNYLVTFSLTAPVSGCVQTAVQNITVFHQPAATASFSYDFCSLEGVAFTDLSTSLDGNPNQWSWDFGDGSTSTLQNPVHQYDTLGTYPITLVTTDDNGCMDTLNFDVEWEPRPIYPVVLEDSRGCIPYTLVFDDNIYPLADYTTEWYSADTLFSTDATPTSLVYPDTGDYDITLVVTSSLGCRDTFSKIATAMPLPDADFFYSPQHPSNLAPTVTFIDKSIEAYDWYWTFGTGATALVQNPVYMYPDTGVYAVTLVATRLNGCTDTITKLIDVEPKFTWFMPNAFTPDSDGNNDGFYGNGIVDKIATFHISIWDRWGALVFESNDPREQWNGKINNSGGDCQQGLYVYVVNITGGRGERAEYKGSLMLVR